MPDGVSQPRTRGADIGVGVVPVHSPGLQDLFYEALVPGPTHVVNHFRPSIFLENLTYPAGQIVEYFLPGYSLPFSIASCSGSF